MFSGRGTIIKLLSIVLAVLVVAGCTGGEEEPAAGAGQAVQPRRPGRPTPSRMRQRMQQRPAAEITEEQPTETAEESAETPAE